MIGCPACAHPRKLLFAGRWLPCRPPPPASRTVSCAAATAGVPLLAGTLPGLYFSRALVGLGEGVAPSAATDIVARR